jgi:hypothetical protein
VIEKRPLALLIYCALLGAFTVFSVCYGAYTFLAPAAAPATIADVALAFVPIAILSTALAGLWFMRWWAVALFWLCVLLMILSMLLVPFSGPTDPFVTALALNAGVWIGVFALPPTLIAVIYRRRFR